MVNSSDDDTHRKKAAILKELESVKTLLNEDQSVVEYNSVEYNSVEPSKVEYPASTSIPKLTPAESLQIPLLDPNNSSTYELDFSKPKSLPEEIVTLPSSPEAREENMPVIDNTKPASLFDDHEESYQSKPSLITEKELKDKARLIVEDLISDAVTQLEKKLDDFLPNLEERLKKKLEKSMDDYIAKALNK